MLESLTVAPNATLVPESRAGSITSARDSLSSRSLIRASIHPWRSLAAWYSAFSLRSPWSRATPISRLILGRSISFSCRSSSRRRTLPSGVMGILPSMAPLYPHLPKGAPIWPRGPDRPSCSPRATRLLPRAGRASRQPKLSTLLRNLVCAAALAGSVASCAATSAESHGALSYTDDAKKAYDKAMEAFDAHEWEEAKTLFKEVKRKYSYSRYARLAELRMADADAESEKLAEAVTGYRSFVHDHRTDPEVPYARFRICKTLF